MRSVYGSHTKNEAFRRLTQLPRLIEPATQIVGSEVYVYQFKINAKAAFGGDVWEWHQDYIFWRNEDGLPAPRVASAAIFLDEVTEFNGPMFVIRSSHKEGCLEISPRTGLYEGDKAVTTPYKNSPAWITNLTADLKYSLNKEAVSRLVSRYGLASPKGSAGSLLFFHGNLVHASSNNISPFDRSVIIITFNSVENLPSRVESPRPGFLVGRDCTAIKPISEDALLLYRAGL